MEHVEVLTRRAEALLELGRAEAAEAVLAQLLAIDPDNPEGLALVMSCHLSAERYTAAATLAEHLLTLRPSDRHALCGLALARLSLGDPRGAVAAAQQAAAGNPDDPEVLLLLAAAMAALPEGAPDGGDAEPVSDLAAALAVVDRAAEIAPESADPLAVRAQLLAGGEQWAESEQSALAALAASPGDASSRLLLAVTRALNGDLTNYDRDARDALRERHEPDLLRMVVAITEALGFPAEMLPTYRAAQASLGQPDYAGELADPELAESALRAGLAASPDDPARLVALARLLAEQDRWAEAWPLLEAAAAGPVPDGDALSLYGLAVRQLTAELTAAAGDATGPRRVPADLTGPLQRAERALDLADLLLDDRSMVGPVADLLQGLVDARTGPVPAELLRVSRRAHRSLAGDAGSR